MAPIQPSASVAATGLGIRYIGNHCYSFSGAVSGLDSEQTLFDFTSGSGYIVATLTMTAPIKMGDVTDGITRGWQLNFNGVTVGLYKTDTVQEDMPTEIEVQILIPPFTQVVLISRDNVSASTFLGTANITGRVYGAE